MIYTALKFGALPNDDDCSKLLNSLRDHFATHSKLSAIRFDKHPERNEVNVLLAYDASSVPWKDQTELLIDGVCSVSWWCAPTIQNKWLFDQHVKRYGTTYFHHYIPKLPDLDGDPAIPPGQGGFWQYNK